MFGLIVTLFFGCLSALGLWKEKPLPTYLFGILSFIGFGFLIIPNSLRPVYMGWLRTAHLMGKVFTTLILVLVYYFVITPSGLIKRIIGGPPLPLKPDPDSSSYWVDRIEPAQPKERYAKRY
jgi:hypothetical protein